MNTIIFIWILWSINLTGPIKSIGEYLTLDRLDGCLAAQRINEINSQPHEIFVCQEVPLKSWYAAKKLPEDLEIQKLRLEIEQLRQETGR